MASFPNGRKSDKPLRQIGEVVEYRRGPQDFHVPPMRAVVRSIFREKDDIIYGVEHIPEWAHEGDNNGGGEFTTLVPGAGEFITWDFMHTWYFKVFFRKGDYIKFTNGDEG